MAAIASLWFRRKASQRWAGLGSLGARFIQREIVLSQRSKPSIRSSPWMRGAPPGWILNNHPEDQLSHFLRRRFPPNPRPDFRDQFPVQAKTSPVPTNYGFRRDDDKSLFPSRPGSTNGDPEQFVERAQARASTPPLQYGKLLP